MDRLLLDLEARRTCVQSSCVSPSGKTAFFGLMTSKSLRLIGLIVGLTSVTACGHHANVDADAHATRLTDNRIGVAVNVQCTNEMIGVTCKELGDYCVVATWRTASTVHDTVRSCVKNSLRLGAKESLTLTSNHAIPVGADIDVDIVPLASRRPGIFLGGARLPSP